MSKTKDPLIIRQNNFIEKFNKINPELTILGDYISQRHKILIKDEYGIEYLVYPNNILKNKPKLPTAVDKNLAFIIKANVAHGNKYDYSMLEYTNSYTKVTIICKNHGKFKQEAASHLYGAGCPLCKNRGFSKTMWIEFCNKNKNSDPKVYIIKCFNKNEEFIKIGMTSKTTSHRFKDNYNMPYSYEVVKEIKGSADFVWNEELKLHRLFKDLKYNPKLHFHGKTECFKLDVLPLLS